MTVAISPPIKFCGRKKLKIKAKPKQQSPTDTSLKSYQNFIDK